MKMDKEQAEEKINEMEEEAKRRYLKYTDWDDIIDNLDDDEKKELNEAYKFLYDEDYPSLKDWAKDNKEQKQLE